MNKKRFTINVASSVTQSLLNGLLYYLLYKYLLQHLGIDLLGVWSILLTIISIASIANLGIGLSIIRIAAKYNQNNFEELGKVVQTAQLLTAAIFFAIAVPIYFTGGYWLSAVVNIRFLPVAKSMLPYIIVCFFINGLNTNVYLPFLDGIQKSLLRSILATTSTLLLLGFSIFLVPKYGLAGVCYAQVIQAFCIFLLSIIGVKKAVTTFNFFSFAVDKSILKQFFLYGTQESINSITQFCFEPLTKSFLGRYGGMAYTAYYEIANRIVIQLRSLLVSANQVMMPLYTITSLESMDMKKANHLYEKNYLVNYTLSTIWLGSIIGIASIVSELFFKQIQPDFLFCVTILAIGYFFNAVALPAYFSNMGKGSLWPNVFCNIIVCIFNIAFGYIFGLLFMGNGVTIACAIALSAGAVFTLISYHTSNKIHFTKTLWKPVFIDTAVIAIFISLLWVIRHYYTLSILKEMLLICLSILLLCFITIIQNAQIKSIFRIIVSKLK
jgi:O-antigen/teichoic acid export membrane protein